MPDFYDLFGRNGLGMLQMMGLGGSGVGFGNLFLVVVMVAVVICRPQQIVRMGAFRRAFFLMGASVLLSPIGNLVFMLMASGGGIIDNDQFGLLIMSLFNHVPAILTGLSILYLGSAIIPSFVPPPEPPSDGNQAPFASDPPKEQPPFIPSETDSSWTK